MAQVWARGAPSVSLNKSHFIIPAFSVQSHPGNLAPPVEGCYNEAAKLRKEETAVSFFKKSQHMPAFSLNPATQEPAVRKSICTGEMTVGYIDKATGKFHDLMLVDRQGLEDFKRQTGVETLREIY
jgi:hypothetical protein